MATARKRMPLREPTVSRGPSGFTVFIIFVLLAALCIGAGFTIGRYILSTLSDAITENGGSGGQSGTAGGTGDGTGGSASGGGSGSSSGAVPAGGGAGTVTCDLNPLSVFAVQIGAFSSRANADKAVADLAGKGYPGSVMEPAAGTSLYKVRTVTVTRKEVAEAVMGRLRSQGYADCFVATENLDATPLSLSGSSLDYLNKAKAGLEALAACLRIEGDLWARYHSGTLDPAATTPTVDALLTTVTNAKNGLASLSPPQDLAALGQAVGDQLAAAETNLESVKAFLTGQKEADRLSAESSYIGLVNAYARLGASLRAKP